MLKGGKNEY